MSVPTRYISCYRGIAIEVAPGHAYVLYTQAVRDVEPVPPVYSYAYDAGTEACARVFIDALYIARNPEVKLVLLDEGRGHV